MKILVIDSASPLEIIAACDGTRSVESCEPVALSHSTTLLLSIDACLKKIGLTPRDLDCLGVGVGPGSFTGIRIAVSTARMLAQVLGKPLVGIPTPLLFALSADACPGDTILVAFDAKKGCVFGALYRRGTGALDIEELIPPGDYPFEHLLDRADPSKTIHLIGDGTEKYRPEAEILEKALFIKDFAPRGDLICMRARDLLLSGISGNYREVVPHYARKSYAETARKAKTDG